MDFLLSVLIALPLCAISNYFAIPLIFLWAPIFIGARSQYFPVSCLVLAFYIYLFFAQSLFFPILGALPFSLAGMVNGYLLNCLMGRTYYIGTFVQRRSMYLQKAKPTKNITQILKTDIVFVFLIFCWLSFLPFFIKTGVSALLILAYQHVVYDSKEGKWLEVFKNVLCILPTTVLYGLLGYLLVVSIPSIAFNVWWLYGSYLFYVLILENRLQSQLIDRVIIPWQRPSELKNEQFFTEEFNSSLGKYYKQIFALVCRSLIKLAPIVFLPQVLVYFQIPLFFTPLLVCVLLALALPKLDASLGWTALMAIGLTVGMYIWPMPAIALWLKGLVITIMLSLIKVFKGSYLKDEQKKYWVECQETLGRQCFSISDVDESSQQIVTNKVAWLSFFVSKGADFAAKDDYGRTALHHAAISGSKETVEYLVDTKNADLRAKDNRERTVLHLAAISGSKETVAYLVDEKGVDLEVTDNLGMTALHCAVISGSLELVKYLVGEKEAEHNAKTKEGVYLPIHLAAFKGNNDILQFLLKKYLGDISDIKSAEGINLLHAAAQGNQPEMIDYLVNVKNMQIDGVDSNGWSALHCAADCNSLKAVKKLLELGANKDLKNKKGHTPLQIAQDKKYEEIINLLSGSYPNKLKL